jgi:hypothetical protein
MEPLRRCQGALVWQDGQVLLLPLQSFDDLASGKRRTFKECRW